MIELTNAKQWKEERVIDFINRWRNLSLNCKDRLCHLIEKCFVFKDMVMELSSEGRILLEEDKIATNQISIEFEALDLVAINLSREDDPKIFKKDHSVNENLLSSGEAEVHFANAKYYTLKVKGSENPLKEEVTTSNNQKEDEVKMEKGKAHVIRYTPKGAKKGDDNQLRIGGDSLEGLTLPAAKIDAIKQPCDALKGFVASSESSLTNQGHAVFEESKSFKSKIDQMLKEFEVESVEKAQHHEVHKTMPRGPVKIDNHSLELEESVGSTFHITTNNDETIEEDMDDALLELEERVKATADELKEINLRTTEEPQPIYISALMTSEEERQYVDLLHEFRDVFAWTYKEMSGLDPRVTVHHLAIKNGTRPIKQAQRRFRPELVPSIEAEVKKTH
ncbi:hypothetical protein LIER_05270 [Lithospermum erythrorhizon]|uniref:Uncharacterized protein n=1 Tax=Lithospermum erythrorhizon TaxID=34254 RepID=A0AAV3P185_LITER